MKYRKIKDKNIPVIGQGTVGLHAVDHGEAVRLINYGIDVGMSFIDTADSYGDGECERIIGEVINDKRDKVWVATKFSPSCHKFDDVIRSAENSLKRLKTDYIDLYQIHWPIYQIDLSETISAMIELVRAGKILHIGVSNFMVENFDIPDKMLSYIDTNQVEYNIYNRFIENQLMHYCKEHNVLIIAYSPLNKGRFPLSEDVLHGIAKKYNKSTCQIMLSWLVNVDNVVAITRSFNQKHIYDNAKSCDFQMLTEDIHILNEEYFDDIQFVDVNDISIKCSGEGNTNVYKSKAEAVDNIYNSVPSPKELSDSIKNGTPIKPIILTQDYMVIDGPVRYWAWVLAYGDSEPIPAYFLKELS